MRFHRRCGDRVTLLNDNSTAIRNFVEFNHGLILSAEPLSDDDIFEVCIDRKVNVWNGSLEIGVTTLDPDIMELPATATKLRNTAWIMSGNSIVKDGVTLVNSYGPELDTLREGDCLGVMRTSKAELMFYVNGRCLGVAVNDLPSRLFAVIDLYGQCVQVSIMHTSVMRPIMESSLDLIEEDPNNDDTLTSSEMGAGGSSAPSQPKASQNVYIPMLSDAACAIVARNRLRFHPRCGILVKLSDHNQTAERTRPLDDYNNGVAITYRPLEDDELFEVRIDRLVDKWSGSIEVGVTTHNPASIRFPSTMTNMDSGTIMMSGCKILLNGHGTCIEYGNFNLDELREGDTVGMMRKSNGKLHYFINGVDQGVAADKVDQDVYGVVDLYGMTVKVSIVDPCEDRDSNISNVPALVRTPEQPATSRSISRIDEDSLLFHTLRDSNVIIINDGKTAHRPNAFEYFNNGIVMTNRTLRTNELFQVRLDLVIPKWAGSIEIGVTQHSSNDIQFPFKMSNAKSGTWAMTGEDVIRDGTIIIPQYVRNLNRLVEGETVGVMRKDMGILHFFVDGVDQGPAAFNIPEHVFGIIDLYGRVAQATIVDTFMPPPSLYSPESPLSTESNATIYPEMCFHRVHGQNARLSRNRLTASRATIYSEFNDAVLFSSRPLRECDMFELRIDKMVDCWIGSLEIGVTAIRPDDLEGNGGVGAVAGTATDLCWDTYILSGAAMMKDGECVRSGYPLDLDTLSVGSRVGMMWHADRSLHYYLDGMDMGKAWYVPHLNIYAVIDLYGQCTQVTILQNEERTFNYNGCTNSDNSLLTYSRVLSSPPPPYWSFSEYCGANICLMHDYSYARRLTADPVGAMVFSTSLLVVGELFEVVWKKSLKAVGPPNCTTYISIKIVECKYSHAGSFRMGVTDINILNAHVNRCLPPSVAYLPHYTAFIDGKYMKHSKPVSKGHDILSFVPSFEWLRPGDRIGLKKTEDSRVQIYFNSEQLDMAFEKVPDKVYAIMEMFGNVSKIQAVSKGAPVAAPVVQNTITNDECYRQQLAFYNTVSMECISAEATGTVIPNNMDSDTCDVDVVTEEPSVFIHEFRNMNLSDTFGAGNDTLVAANNILITSNDRVVTGNDTPVTGNDTPVIGNDTPVTGNDRLVTRNDMAVAGNDTPPAGYNTHGGGSEQLMDGNDTSGASNATPGAVNDTLGSSYDASGAGNGTPCAGNDATGVGNDQPTDGNSTSGAGNDKGNDSVALTTEPRRRLHPLPYTFHYIHGKHIRLCSSDTVAVRNKGYNDGISIASHPLRRGHHFSFRVDKVTDYWQGTVTIGAVGSLPTEELPAYAVHLEPQVWVISSDILLDNGTYTYSDMAISLNYLTEQSVLTMYFRFNSELVLEIDGNILGPITTIPRNYSHVFPLIDLYGSILQVSILLHPYPAAVVLSGASLDLPIIAENLREESLAELELAEVDSARTSTDTSYMHETWTTRKPKSYSQDNLIEEELEPIIIQAGPSTANPLPLGVPTDIDFQKIDINRKKSCPKRLALHHSLMLPENTPMTTDNNGVVTYCLQKSHSSHNFQQIADDNRVESELNVTLRHSYSVGSRVGDAADEPIVHEQICDTNIQHNDRYPEANDVDNLDTEIIDALTLETGNLPDLTEEQSSSIDESTRRDDFWSETLSTENINYLNRILCFDQEESEGHSLESEWEASGEGCEHLHLVLKYWNFLVLPYPELRQAVSWGQVRCYCHNCQPDAPPSLAGWVRIERIDGVGACRRAYWYVARHSLGAAQAQSGPARRPRSLAPAPCASPPVADIWFDEEGKPHHTVLAIEIDIDGSEAENDRLLAFLIYLKPHLVFIDDNPPSLEE